MWGSTGLMWKVQFRKSKKSCVKCAKSWPRSTRGSSNGAPVYDAAHKRLEAELGDLLFAAVNLCRKAGVHPALALDSANSKFATRFHAVERLAAERGIAVGSASLAELDALWDQVKSTE